MSRNMLPAVSTEAGLAQYLQEISQFPMLEEAEEKHLATRWSEHGDVDAAHKLVTSHLRLVAKVASGFRGYGLPVLELISEGNIGLMQAVKRFDPKRGFRLSTYALWWIKASMQEYVLRSWSLVKIGTTATQKKLFFNLGKMKRRIRAAHEGSLQPDEIATIAQELNVPESEVMEMDTRLMGHDQSLNAPMVQTEDGSGAEWIDYLEDKRHNQEILLLEDQEKRHKRLLLTNALASLNDRERDIIQERRLKDAPATLEELSQVYGISCERVRQIENRAMQKLQSFAANA